MRLTVAHSKIKKRNLVLINSDTYQRETLSERPIRHPLNTYLHKVPRTSVSAWGRGSSMEPQENHFPPVLEF